MSLANSRSLSWCNVLVAPDRWMVDSLLESSLEMRHAFRTTPESHFLAQIISSFSANGALAARNADFKRNSVADREAIDLWTNAHNYTGRFMAK